MRRPIWVLDLLAIFAFVFPGKAQDETPKAEVYVGYDYVRLNSGSTAFNFNGGSGQLAYNVSDWLARGSRRPGRLLHQQRLSRGNIVLPVRAAG